MSTTPNRHLAQLYGHTCRLGTYLQLFFLTDFKDISFFRYSRLQMSTCLEEPQFIPYPIPCYHLLHFPYAFKQVTRQQHLCCWFHKNKKYDHTNQVHPCTSRFGWTISEIRNHHYVPLDCGSRTTPNCMNVYGYLV